MSKTFNRELGARIKKARISANKTQQECADRLGIAAQNFGCLERGERQIDVDTYFKVCDILNIDADELLKEVRKYVYKP